MTQNEARAGGDLRNGRSGRALDATRGRRKCRDALDIDGATADRTDDLSTLVELSARDHQRVAIRSRLSQQRAGLGPLVRDRRAFGIVLVVRGGQLRSLDDGGNDGLEGRDLTVGAFLLGLHDRQEALDVGAPPG